MNAISLSQKESEVTGEGQIPVSVIMPVHNGGIYLRQAIQSILDQSFRDFELIIINDGSSDDTEAIVGEYSDSRIVYLRNDVNLGLVNSLNKALKVARGEFVARMDADDVSREDRLFTQVEYLRTHPAFALVASVADMIDRDGQFLGVWEGDRRAVTEEQIYQMLAKTNCIVHPSVMMRADVARQFVYRHETNAAEDYDLWLRMRAAGLRMAKINEPLILYRIHQSSITAGQKALTDHNLRVFRQKCFFLKYAFRRGILNEFVLRVMYSTLRSYAAFLRNQSRAFARSVKWLCTISPFRARTQLKQLRQILARQKPEFIFFFPYTHMGGAERVHADIVHAFGDKRCLVVFTGFSSGNSFLPAFSHPNAEVLNIPDCLYSPVTRSEALECLLDFIHSPHSPVLMGSNSEYYLRLLPRLKSEVFCADLIHAFKFQPGANIAHAAFLPMTQRLNRRVFVSRNALNEFVLFLRHHLFGPELAERLVYISNCTNIPADLPAKVVPAKVIFVGRNSPEKRFHLFVQLAERFSGRDDVSFEAAGLDAVNSTCVVCRGELFDAELDAFYADATLLVLPSSREGFPMVVMEAMAHGTIPVCTDVGDIPNHLNGSNGVLIHSSSEADIVSDMERVIKEILGDKSRRERMSEAAYHYARTHFGRDAFNRSYRELLGD